MPSTYQEHSKTSAYNAYIVHTIHQVFAAMHYSFRALYKHCQLTSIACRYKLPSGIITTGPVHNSIRTFSPGVQPVLVSDSVGDRSHCFASAAHLSKPVYPRLTGTYPLQIDFTLNSGLNFDILNATYQSEMPKRKHSHSEHSKRKLSRSEGAERKHTRSEDAERKRSSSKHSKRERRHSEPSKDKKKRKADKEDKPRHSRGTRRSSRLRDMKKSEQEDDVICLGTKKCEEEDEIMILETFVNSSQKASKYRNADKDSGPKSKSPRKDKVSDSYRYENKRYSGKESSPKSKSPKMDKDSYQKENKRFKQTESLDSSSSHSSFGKGRHSSSRSTSLFNQTKRSYTPPPNASGFTQRDFSTLIPKQFQSRTSTPPPELLSAFSTTCSTHSSGRDRNRDQTSSKSSYASADEAQNRRIDHQEKEHRHGPRRNNPFDFRRHWKDTSLGRKHKNKPYPGMEFMVMSYNVLAQKLIQMNDYLYHHCPDYILNWDYRKRNLIGEIANTNSDILCLQEVQGTHYTSFYEPEMRRLGYSGVFKQRTGDKHDGCATFFNASRFDLVDSRLVEYYLPGVPLMDRDNVAVVIVLQPKGLCQAERICVANTHLLFNPKRGDIKLTQLGVLLAEIDKLSFIQNSGAHRHHPIVMCGDFNSVPDCHLVEFVQNGRLYYDGLKTVDVSGQEPWKQSRSLSPPLWPHGVGVTDRCQYRHVMEQRQRHCMADERKTTDCEAKSKDTTGAASPDWGSSQNSDKDENEHEFSSTLAHPFHFQSSYICNSDSKEVTTNHKRTNCIVDYIFHASENVSQKEDFKQLRVLSRLSLFTNEEANHMGGLPNAKWSSDHFALAIKFLLMPRNSRR